MAADSSDEILDDAKFDEVVKTKKADGTLPEFTAQLVWNMSKKCDACQSSTYSKKQSTSISIVSSVTTAVMAWLTLRFTGGN